MTETRKMINELLGLEEGMPDSAIRFIEKMADRSMWTQLQIGWIVTIWDERIGGSR